MKGISLITTTVILIILGIIILLVWVFLTGQAKGTVDIALTREILRLCCSDRAVWDCTALPNTINCKVPWGTGTETLEDLADIAGIDPGTQLDDFCNC